MTDIVLNTIPDGGVASASGFRAAGIHAGFRHDPKRLDMALVEADELCPAAATFTQNVFCAAPIMVSKEHLNNQGYGLARAIVINSGIANAATGTVGLAAAKRTADIASEIIGCVPEDVLVASTGVIGTILDTNPFDFAIRTLQRALYGHPAHEDADQAGLPAMGVTGLDAAKAIMTTDTVPKQAAVSWVSADPDYEGITFTVGGMSKGSGMIMPNMATMIAVITTDAPLAGEYLHDALLGAVNQSFNKITVDSDTSTNDCCFLMASGKAADLGDGVSRGTFAPDSIAMDEFKAALDTVTNTLAKEMARDGEGATKLVEVTITGAATPEEAEMAARTVANSPLVKTAIYGHDANWGRIAAALGRSGATFAQENVSIDMVGLPVMRNGLPLEFDEDEALRRFEDPEITIVADLGAGDATDTMWTCDFSHDYVSINGDYRS